MGALRARDAGLETGGRIDAVRPGTPLVQVVLISWCIAVYATLWHGPDLSAGLAAIENDNAMRLVQVRDLLAGQGWFDLYQHRLGPEGTFMHWSRLVDAPIAGLILLFRPLLGRESAELATMIVWPALLIVPLLIAIAATARALGTAKAPFFACLSAAAGAILLSSKFTPGSLDHHNVQLVLLVVVVASVIFSMRRARFGALAGAAIATSLAVGIEMIVHMAASAVAMAVYWAWQGKAARRPTVAFSLGLAGFLTVLFLGTAPAEAYTQSFCDALSLELFLPVLAGAIGVGLLAGTLSAAGRAVRIGAIAILSALIGALAFRVAPSCLGNPLNDLDPLLQSHWLERVNETRNIIEMTRAEPGAYLGVYIVGAIAILIAISFAKSHVNRAAWIYIAAMVAVSFGIASYQVRGTPALMIISVLPTSVLVARLIDRSIEGGRAPLLGVLGFFVSGPLFWALLLTLAIPSRMEKPVNFAECSTSSSFERLAALPPGLVSASSNLGPSILRFTHHRVLSAPYHRNTNGILAQIRIAFAPAHEAEEQLKRAHVDYLVVCDSDPEYIELTPTSPKFMFDLVKSPSPAFLSPMEGNEQAMLQIFRVQPPS